MKKRFTFFKSENSQKMAIFLLSISLFVFIQLANNTALAQVCCPEFKIKDAVEICPPEGACNIDVPGGQADKVMAACKESAHVYTIYPNDAAYSYTWTVNGGTIATNLGNPKVIVWGTGSVGYIKVVISNLATGGTCLDSITAQVCLIDGPEANFIADQDTVCVNTAVHFTNLSLGGSVYLWDFGDGITSTLATPLDHPYANPGTYTVTLTVTDMGAGHWLQVFQGEDSIIMQVPCGCSDTITKKIVVLPGEGPKIETDCCYGTVCAGDTSSFCTTPPPPGCPAYNWTVTGGTIISGAGTHCVSVKWSPTYVGPTTISLETPGCSTAPCEGTTILNVPVFYPSLPISGPLTLCQGASGTFSLPTLPGTYYNWTVSGGGYQFNLQDRNTPTVNISFFDATSYTIKCEYNNPLANCGPGTSTFNVDVLPEFVFTYGEEQVCEGTTHTYYTNGDATWIVSPGGPGIVPGVPPSSADITWNTPGTYTITATAVNAANFCNLNAIKVVEVIAKPVLNPIAGNDSVCPGENVTYSIISDKKDQTFVWSISGGTGTIQTEMGSMHDSAVVQWTGAGPWQLSVYQKGEPGVSCDSDPVLLDVFPFLAPVIGGASTVCVDASEVYTAGGSNPSGDFDWIISPAAQGTIQSGQGTNSVTILWHGPSAPATLKVTSCTGSDTHPINITGRPVADVSYSTLPVFCQGDATILTLSTPNFGTYSYDWYEVTNGSEGVYTNTLNINIASLGVGTHQYYVLVKENGCEFKSNIVDVIIKDCTIFGGGGGGCDAIAWFWPYIECDQVTLIDKSFVTGTPPPTIISYAWSYTGAAGATFTSIPPYPNQIFTAPLSGSYTIRLDITSSSGCTSFYEETIDILLPTASFTYTAPLCDNAPISFTASPSNPTYSYAWDFGDGFTSFIPNTEHIYGPPAPASYMVTLEIRDEKGCVAKDSLNITVNPSPACTIIASDTIFCPGSFETLSAPCGGTGWGYQWYKNGKPIPGANDSTYNVYEHGEYHAVVTNTNGCSNPSNKIYMYMKPLPFVKLTGDGHICAYPSSLSGVYLIANYNINYIYTWSCNDPLATFSPATSYATWASLTLPAVLPATYEFIVQVTDTTTWCINSDTLCVTFYEKPTVSFPFIALCEGTPATLTPTLDDFSKYTYKWNTGETTPTIVASNPGHYSLTVTDKIGGCQTTADAAIIISKPDLSLFPLGCATICPPDILNLYIPLPLNAFWPHDTYSSAYPSITWYDNGDYTMPVGYGETFNFPASGTGNHEFSVVVQNSFGCVDTAGVFCLTDNAVCCEIIAAINQTDASCVNSADGSFSIYLDPTSTVSPFTVTISPPPNTVTIPAGGSHTFSGLAPGSYVVTITDASGQCEDIIDVEIGFLQDECCFAEIDPGFVHILNDTVFTTDVVWDNKYYIDDNVMVTMNGAMFDITNVDVVFGECAGIEFINGGYLRANNSVFRPCDIDKSWRGLRFDGAGEFDNIVNESTFKNAEIALYFKDGADAVVSSGLFSNCNYGIRVEGNNNFNHPISGNRFVSDDFFPVFACQSKYSFVNNSSTYGIYSKDARFIDQVSHNEFINAKGYSLPVTFGVYQSKGGGVFSENTFTDIGTAGYFGSQTFYTGFENNEIEANLQTLTNFGCVYVISCTGPVIEIANNEITNNYSQWVSPFAIYTANSTNISIANNEIDGFYHGIVDIGSINHQVTKNVITNSRNSGIYVMEQANSRGYITCNSITMKDYNFSIGIIATNMSSMSEVSSNCISDCYTSMNFSGWTGGGNILPLIRNNFLYNYAHVGINVQGVSGNIGTGTDPGLNTLWSNKNTAVDINSNTSITVADNFGMFNISFPWVQITSNNPYHSTASCGHQIFNMPSQGNLNTNYDCDNPSRKSGLMTGAGGNFYLEPGYQEVLKSSPAPFEDASMIMASVENADLALLNEIIQVTDLTPNQEALLKYDFHYRNGDYQNARTSMEMFTPLTPDEQDYKTLSMYGLDAIANGWDQFSDGDIETMKMVAAEESVYANLAISLLNNVSGYRDHITEEVVAPDVTWTENIKRVETDGSYLNIYPNPVKNTAYIEFIDNTDGNSKIEVFDIRGKLVSDININTVSGGIEMDVQQLQGGIYFVTITNPESGFIQKGKMVKIDNQ